MKKKAISERQRQANRINGALGGPKSQAGKDISRQNARTHSLTADILVLSIEDKSRFEAVFREYTEEFNPVGIEERDLVEEIVVGRWRQKRIWGVEAALFELALLESEEAIARKFETADETTRIAFSLLRQHGHHKTVELLNRYEGRMRRLHERARRDLEHVQASKMPKPARPEPKASQPKIPVQSIISKPQPVLKPVWTSEPKSVPTQPDSDLREEPKPPRAA